MQSDKPFFFETFRLEPRDERLFCANAPVPLTPKSFAVLSFLLQNANRLVTKEELIRSVWSDSCVSDASLKVCVREVRQALGDEAQSPRFVETVHRRGYRFIGKLTGYPTVESLPSIPDPDSPSLVGREEELNRLGSLLTEAKGGKRQVAFLTGEPGSGKTTLVGEFTRRAAAAGAWVAIGQCFEQFAAGEGRFSAFP